MFLLGFGNLVFQKIYQSNLNDNLTPITSLAPRNTPTPVPTATPTVAPLVTIGLMGDLGLGRTITSIARKKHDFSWSFSGVSPWLQQNDFNLANLESPIINNCPEGKPGTFTFCGDTKFLPELKQNKFVFSLANNHILNYGSDGLKQTKTLLKQNDIEYVYSHEPGSEFIIKTVKGIKFGFLGFDLTGGHKFDKNSILPLIKKYDKEADWLIVSLHWGNEYLTKPESWRVDLAHLLVDNGADIIAGHHPHVVQSEETYQGKPIFYSLGNFIFDQNWSQPTSQSVMVRLVIEKNKIKDINNTPIIIKSNSRPEIVKTD